MLAVAREELKEGVSAREKVEGRVTYTSTRCICHVALPSSSLTLNAATAAALVCRRRSASSSVACERAAVCVRACIIDRRGKRTLHAPRASAIPPFPRLFLLLTQGPSSQAHVVIRSDACPLTAAAAVTRHDGKQAAATVRSQERECQVTLASARILWLRQQQQRHTMRSNHQLKLVTDFTAKCNECTWCTKESWQQLGSCLPFSLSPMNLGVRSLSPEIASV